MTEARVTQGSKNAISVHLFLVQKKTFYNLKTIWIELKKKKVKEENQADDYLYSFKLAHGSYWTLKNYVGWPKFLRNMPVFPIKFQLWLLQNFLLSAFCLWNSKNLTGSAFPSDQHIQASQVALVVKSQAANAET